MRRPPQPLEPIEPPRWSGAAEGRFFFAGLQLLPGQFGVESGWGCLFRGDPCIPRESSIWYMYTNVHTRFGRGNRKSMIPLSIAAHHKWFYVCHM